MNRVEWCEYMAALSASPGAAREQIEAFTHLYLVNTAPFGDVDDLIEVQDITLGFWGIPSDIQVTIRFFANREAFPLSLALNYRGGQRIPFLPDSPFLTRLSLLRWQVEAGPHQDPDDTARDQRCVENDFRGCLRYIDQDAIVHTVEINGRDRSLSQYVLLA